MIMNIFEANKEQRQNKYTSDYKYLVWRKVIMNFSLCNIMSKFN